MYENQSFIAIRFKFSIMFIGVNLNVFILIVVMHKAIEIFMIIIEILKKFYYRTALF